MCFLESARGGGEANNLARWAGLGQKAPILAGAFALFLLSFAGIPLTSGFIGKMAVFSTALSGGFWPLVVIAVLGLALTGLPYMYGVAISASLSAIDWPWQTRQRSVSISALASASWRGSRRGHGSHPTRIAPARSAAGW